MSTDLQIQANRENAKLSTGPTSEAGKAISSRNNTRHGLTGAFRVLPHESQEEFDQLLADFREEHKPETLTETTLVEHMAQHLWLRRRAVAVESFYYDEETGQMNDEKQLALCLRYQTTHERAFHKCLNDLLKLRAAKRKAEIGFESQRLKQAEEIRKQERQQMKKERHQWEIADIRDKVESRNSKESERMAADTSSLKPAA